MTTGVLKAGALLCVVLTVQIASAASPQQEGAAQPSAEAPTALRAMSVSPSERSSPHPHLAEAGTAGRIADSGASLSFLSPFTFDAAGTLGFSVLVADVNGDGIPDVLANNGAVSVLLGNGNGTFQPAATYNTGGLVTSIAVADVNGDGKPDVVVVNDALCQNSNLHSCVGVLLGRGDGTFQDVVTYDSGGVQAESIAVADVNGDGKLDVVVAHYCTSFQSGGCSYTDEGTVGVLLGRGDGTLKKAVIYSAGGYKTSGIAVGDVNADGKTDVVVANQCAQQCEFDAESGVAVLLGIGDGTFQPAVSYDPDGNETRSVIVADVNGDNKLDLIASSGESVGVFLGNGDGTFKPVVSYVGAGGNPGAVADVNQDGKLDLAYPGGNFVAVLLGNGDGSFQPIQTYNAGAQEPVAVAAADFNGDGWADVVFINRFSFNYGNGDGLVGVLLNNTDSALLPTTTLLFSSLNPSFAGQAVTLSATVSSSTGPPPDGSTVTFYYYGKPGIVGTSSLSGGTASVTTSLLPTGTSVLTAIYSGNSTYGPSMSAQLNQVVNSTTKSATATTLVSSLNPSIYGQKVTWTSTVTTSGSLAPTGKVKFTWNGYSIGTATLNAGGVATLTKSNLNADPYPLTATYVGDANNLSSISPILNQAVTEATSSATLTSSPNPSMSGQAVTFTATITSPTDKPTGPVTFTAGTKLLGTAQISRGKAIFTASTLAVGSTQVTATYAGNSNIAESSASVTQTVQ
jgi:hypothetical protein